MGELVRYDAMCRAIAAAHEVDEVKDIRDKARAIEMYARQAQNTEAEEKARNIRLRAERRCGQMVAELPRSPGFRSDVTPPHEGKRLFSEECERAGISPKQAENWQKLAAVPEAMFEEALAEPNPSTSGISGTIPDVEPTKLVRRCPSARPLRVGIRAGHRSVVGVSAGSWGRPEQLGTP